MYLMDQGPSEIMMGDEQLVCRQFDTVLGEGTVIVDGKRVFIPASPGETPYEEFSFVGNVQPVTGDDLVLVPEGDRFNEQLFVWVWTEGQQVPDINSLVMREGQFYHTQAAETWGSYSRLRIQRVDVGPDRAIGV